MTKDFWYNWWSDKKDSHILLAVDKTGNSGTAIVEETVYAVGYNNDFIIAKQHPNLENEVAQRLFNIDTAEGTYLLKDPADTIWLAKDDSIYFKNNKCYHIGNGWNPPDSLKPYKAITNFYIIDIRRYKANDYNSYIVYKLSSVEEFDEKRRVLHVPFNLKFTIYNKEYE